MHMGLSITRPYGSTCLSPTRLTHAVVLHKHCLLNTLSKPVLQLGRVRYLSRNCALLRNLDAIILWRFRYSMSVGVRLQ